jgi:hypothetical protein
MMMMPELSLNTVSEVHVSRDDMVVLPAKESHTPTMTPIVPVIIQ